MITRNLNTPESRAFWAAAERASRRVATWPAWKLGQLESREREQESMATKKEVWVSSKGDTYQTELGALLGEQADLFCEYTDHDLCEYVIPELDGEMIAAIDALHEYAHRGNKDESPDTQRDTGTALPEGVPPELDDWVKRWEWITARATEDQIRHLQAGDEVRIGADWYRVDRRGTCAHSVFLAFVGGTTAQFLPRELATVASEVRYNGR
jgi:hypothetical protein